MNSITTHKDPVIVILKQKIRYLMVLFQIRYKEMIPNTLKGPNTVGVTRAILIQERNDSLGKLFKPNKKEYMIMGNASLNFR